MKKIIVLIIPLIIYVVLSSYFTKNNVIPANAIRIRILANSNRVEDQELKIKVKENLEPYLYQLLIDNKNVEEAKLSIINKNRCAGYLGEQEVVDRITGTTKRRNL